jgi:bifunctional pyridoxal-dependent enzyme with beta-cystathionase and maltose regulon repressor activities
MLMASDPDLFGRLREASLHHTTVHGCNVLAQVAATAALNECADWLSDFVNHLQQMRDLSLKEIESIPGFRVFAPQGCYLLFCNISQTGMESSALQSILLEKAKVAVVPGLPRWFGDKAEGHIRICFSTSEVLLKEAFGRIRQTMNQEFS